jgi:hypothetical protein
MKKYTWFILLLFPCIIYLNSSCKPDERSILPKVTGSAGEVLLIIDKYHWEQESGIEFRNLLTQYHPALPQPEPIFDLIHVTPDQFTKIFQSHRNIIFAEIGSEYYEPKIAVQRNLWSTPQIVIKVQAPDDSALVELLRQSGNKIVSRINRTERDRIVSNYKGYQVQEIVKSLKNKHNLSLYIPKGYDLDADADNFIWIAHETPLTTQSILVYYYQYTDTNTFTSDYLINKRNLFLKKHVPGPVPNTYMATEELVPPDFKEFMYQDRYFAELRGLWKLENGFMGGPFVSLSTVDEKRNRVVTVEGFVYAPRDKKREFLRQVESILYTLEFY